MGDVSLNNGGYQASGWKPSGPALKLPSEYGPPPQTEVEVSKENIQFAGQVVSVAPAPNNAYLPPTTESQRTSQVGIIKNQSVFLDCSFGTFGSILN